MNRKAGFTLIELLVAVAILGVLISIGTVSFTSFQGRGNDSKRKSDLQRVKLALEKYRLDNYYYPPISEGECQPQLNQGCAKTSLAGGSWILELSPGYLKIMPKDPRQAAEKGNVFARVFDFLVNHLPVAFAGQVGPWPPRTPPPPTSPPTAPPTFASPTPTPSPPPPPACSDALDNDGDFLVDLNDPGCRDFKDNDETHNPLNPPPPRCSDGFDNDEDGKIDYPNDPGCTSATDSDETDPPPPGPTPVAATPTPPGASPSTPAGPGDFNLSYTYRYDVFPNHQSYILWASLENTNDPEIYYKTTATCRQEPPKSASKYLYNFCVTAKI